LVKVSCKADLQKAEAAAKDDGFLLMDASDWKVTHIGNATLLAVYFA
jgi:hypothetical protein